MVRDDTGCCPLIAESGKLRDWRIGAVRSFQATASLRCCVSREYPATIRLRARSRGVPIGQRQCTTFSRIQLWPTGTQFDVMVPDGA